MTDIRSLNFVIGVDRADLIGDEGLLSGDNIAHASKSFIHDIYVQIYAQAKLRYGYYQVLQCERGESKDAKMIDVLSRDEFVDERRAFAVCNFFGRKCKETAINKGRPFDLRRAYGNRNPGLLVFQRAQELLSDQRYLIESIKREKGWK